MKAAVIYHPGGSEHFVLEERPIPDVKLGWVLVKVKAFGLNRSELMTRKGYSPDVKFPRVLGIECVGQVVNDPSGELQPEQKVAAFMGGMGRDFDGSYQQYALLPKHLLYTFESHLSWKELGAIPEMFQTVYGSLHLALKIKAGETLLIRGGTSSIGLLAAQLAKKAGLTVIATTRNVLKKEFLISNGADHVLIEDGQLEAKVKAIYKNGTNKVLELVGTSTLKDSLACCAPGGSVCMTGMLAEQWAITDFAPMEYIPATVNLTVYDSGQIRV
ncbi:MAG: NADPH:quinone reductase, partial [Sphingobacteriaceae bacterium]